ncbi:MAG: hypothetical protein V4485_03760, partial [Pseudomonadota bacterium]
MKIFAAIIFIIIAALCGVIFIPGALEHAIKFKLENSLNNKTLRTTIGKVTLTNGLITISDIKSSYDNIELITVDDATIHYDIKRSIKKLALVFDVKISNFHMEELKFDASGSVAYATSYLKLSNGNVTFASGGGLDASLFYKTKLGRANLLMADINIDQIPVMLHKNFWRVFPDNDTMKFLRDFVLNGTASGNLKFNLDKDFFVYHEVKQESFLGQFSLLGVDLKYNAYFPIVQNINADAKLAGGKLVFNISQGYSGKVRLYDGIVSLDWDKGEDGEVLIHTKGEGP